MTRKRKFKLLLLALGFLGLIAATGLLPSTAQASVKVTAQSGVNLRSSPNGRQVLSIPHNTVLTQTGKAHGNWIPVRYHGHSGYVWKPAIKHVGADQKTEAGLRCPNGTCGHKSSHKKKLNKIGSKAGPKTDYASKLQRAINRGVGRRAGKNKCYRAVKKILLSAGLVKSYLPSVAAYNARRDLAKAGFHNDMKACQRPGVIRVYKGAASQFLGQKNAVSKARNYMKKKWHVRFIAGDLYGHVEIYGTDHKYHSFYDSDTPVTKHAIGKNNRRVLVGCFVK